MFNCQQHHKRSFDSSHPRGVHFSLREMQVKEIHLGTRRIHEVCLII
ncbi:Uncharacterised protein [Serratia plymuthica]|nr:Uncharacterised protein [Serratia plymuthica]VEI19823.1 Uncharacterised protein [Serratia plymuthica]